VNPVTGLDALEARFRQDLVWLELPPKSWVIQRRQGGEPLLDVAIIGAGMAGLTAATALKFLGIRAVNFDRAPEGFEGPWATTARMETLRSPKQLTGPCLGFSSLTFRAWFEAQHGQAAWQALDKIPRLQWMDYLRWYRRMVEPEVRNEHEVLAVEPHADGRVSLRVRHAGHESTVQARRVILATGRDGLGAAWYPDFAQHIPMRLRAHSSDALDYSRLRGLRVAVIGGGASAMDCAATALESGAQRVDLLIRRRELPRVNKGKGSGSAGMTHGFVNLPDEWKWRIRHYVNEQQTPPPRGSTQRVSRHDNARFWLGASIDEVRTDGSTVRLLTPRGEFEFDFVLFSTGFRVDFTARPEFAAFSSHLRLWGQRYQPESGAHDDELSESPDLGPAFEFRERVVGSCPGIDRIHCFCYPATLTHGTVAGDIPAISEGAHRLAQGLASLFLAEGIEQHFEAIQAFEEPELLGDEWAES
jgi:cation diffusion facilitator CzcD-associated flavoprotein CzcO